MAYCSVQDLLDRCGTLAIVQLSNPDDSEAETVNEGVVNRAILDACGEMDGYLAARYSLPLAETPATLNTLAIDLALYRLAALGRLGVVEEDHKLRKEDAVRYLRDLAKGLASLGLDPAVAPSTQVIQASASPRLFGREGLGRF